MKFVWGIVVFLVVGKGVWEVDILGGVNVVYFGWCDVLIFGSKYEVDLRV